MSKERLEEIKTWLNRGFDLTEEDIEWLIEQVGRVQELEKQNKNYRKAIKECVERMNEGGAGTRSFVYEKLSEALEGDDD